MLLTLQLGSSVISDIKNVIGGTIITTLILQMEKSSTRVLSIKEVVQTRFC